MGKKIPNIYLRQYGEFQKKPTRKSFIVAFIVIIIVVIGAIGYKYMYMLRTIPQKTIAIVQKETISVYFPTGRGKLAEKKIDIQNNIGDKEKGDIIIRSLKDLKSIPEKLILNEFVVDPDGVIYLNFSKDIVEGKTASMTEISKTFSIVNSFLKNLNNTKRVQFLVDGQPLYTLGGTLYTYKPIEFNQDVLED
jgi:hypothetical protein